jgi:hypothetical protein
MGGPPCQNLNLPSMLERAALNILFCLSIPNLGNGIECLQKVGQGKDYPGILNYHTQRLLEQKKKISVGPMNHQLLNQWRWIHVVMIIEKKIKIHRT